MAEQNALELVRWQDLKVKSELEIVLEIAQKEGWKDCEVFGHGDMIMEPQESKGWKLIPADQYKDSIPLQAVERLHQIINAGIRVRGVIIADDGRRTEPTTEVEIIPAPVMTVRERPKVSLSFLRPVVLLLARVLLGVVCIAGIIAIGLGILALVSAVAQAFVHIWWILPVGLLFFGIANAGTRTGQGTGSTYDYDPQLVILVDDGTGGTSWVSLFTWYD
jgi:hypothetical protein